MTAPVITVKNGKLCGKIEKDYDGGQYYSFRGIPYAKPPIGSLRFRAPVPAEPWDGIKDATKDGSDCFANNPILLTRSGSEDCLFLNVYTRELFDNSKSLKPVMVWVHGGGFIMGSGSSLFNGPEFLITKEVVIVSLNYRIGLLGFLSFDDQSLGVPGNAGLKDQVLALKWVQENIKQFNGDPNNVTIFGLSAGAASVHYLLLSPLTKGLFHKCIIQSGSALCPWALGEKTLPYLTEALKTKTTNEKEILEMLEKMSVEELINFQDKISDNINCSFKRCFAPVVEYKSEHAFITEKPQDIIKSGNFHHVPIIIGFTSREGLIANFFQNESKTGYVISDFENKIPFTFNLTKGSELSKLAATKIKNFYYGNQQPSEVNNDQFYLLEGDVSFEWPIIETIKKHKAVSSEPIYFYRVSIETSLNFAKKMFELRKHIGASHGDDFGYIFITPPAPEIIPNSLEENIMRSFVAMWTNFAISGNPNLPQKVCLLKLDWKPVDGKDLHYLEIGENLTVGLNPNENRMEFWNKINSLKDY